VVIVRKYRVDRDAKVNELSDFSDVKWGSGWRKRATDRPLSRTTDLTVSGAVMEDHDFGFNGKSQTVVFEPGLANMHPRMASNWTGEEAIKQKSSTTRRIVIRVKR